VNVADRSGLVRLSRRVSAGWRRLTPAARIALSTALALILIFAAMTAGLLMRPAQGMPAQVSAIVMLAGPGARLPVALQLAQKRRASVLIVSQGTTGMAPRVRPGHRGCSSSVSTRIRQPPAARRNTSGRLAKKYHWIPVVVVTSRPQATRARLLVERCFGGAVYSATGSLPLRNWPYQIALRGAIAKALFVDRTC
jgi:hypothetical protein